jgi:hypothetical protein
VIVLFSTNYDPAEEEVMRRAIVVGVAALSLSGCVSRQPAQTASAPRIETIDSLRTINDQCAAQKELVQAIARLTARLDSANSTTAPGRRPPNEEIFGKAVITDSSMYRDLQRIVAEVHSLVSAAKANPTKYINVRISP